jgi:hypothetical protein
MRPQGFIYDPNFRVEIRVQTTELYYITGGGAPISLQSNKCRQKHGGFSRLLTPE